MEERNREIRLLARKKKTENRKEKKILKNGREK